MTTERTHDALQTIFSFFLGLMVVMFVGVGVNTFYPNPADKLAISMQKLYDQQSTQAAKVPTPVSSVEQTAAAALQKKINALQTQQRTVESGWQRNTSIVLILFATFVMAISLIRSEQLRVISNGLLLGGLFTMVYGSGWTIASGDSMARFLVITFGLIVTVSLGYLKFIRGRTAEPATPGAPQPPVTPTA